ncbi:DUF1634 domain-containing protein [bacterium]|nr:DUF1634 domain-containing protein [bacterium]
MAKPDQSPMELVLAKLMALGVYLSATIVVAGLGWSWILRLSGHPRPEVDLSQVNPAAVPHTLPQLFEGIQAGDPVALMGLGLLCLILTPMLRVVTSLILFIKQRDWLYTGICAFVLTMLLIGMLLGAHE